MQHNQNLGAARLKNIFYTVALSLGNLSLVVKKLQDCRCLDGPSNLGCKMQVNIKLYRFYPLLSKF
ncbi:MAG TPA: hypothetical protein DCY88_07385 [Cyanobacteria bacterium UBA11372]|nr:hypothetical protein [Cyanobacteria bacterium UBA11372]HBE48791.1 hypothetical protein [Cyanobacteria bacterium UBA11369]